MVKISLFTIDHFTFQKRNQSFLIVSFITRFNFYSFKFESWYRMVSFYIQYTILPYLTNFRLFTTRLKKNRRYLFTMMRQEWRTFNGGAWEKEIQEIIDQFIMKLRLLLTCPKSCCIYIARAGSSNLALPARSLS